MKKLQIYTILVITVFLLLSVFIINDQKGYTSKVELNAEETYELVQNSIFYVRNIQNDRVRAVGTGFLIDSEGRAITANHVIEGAEEIEVTLVDGSVIKNIKVIDFNREKDVAILKLPVVKGLKHLMVNNVSVKHGTEIFAIGFPIKDTPIITEGIINTPNSIINGKRRMLASAEIVSGMSGGPIVDKSGKVVGVISGSLRTMNNIHLIVNAEDITSVLKAN